LSGEQVGTALQQALLPRDSQTLAPAGLRWMGRSALDGRTRAREPTGPRRDRPDHGDKGAAVDGKFLP